MQANWQIIFLLPNLCLPKAIGNDAIAIVPCSDQRVVEIISASSIARHLVESFEDQFGKRVSPALLLTRSDLPDSVRSIDAMVGFRNILALSTIIKGYEHGLTCSFVSCPLYSDYFDFYPIAISRNNQALIIDSPSVLGFNDRYQYFKGQTAPGLASPGNVASPAGDLFAQLEKVWIRRFVSKKLGEWRTRALFRSLEMAYHATAMSSKNHSTLYDFGTSASLWVSAFEILSHPRSGKADLLSVLQLLGKYNWAEKRVARKAYRVKYRNHVHKVNLVQKLYKQLYEARNDFLHGNPVRSRQLHPFRDEQVETITRFAPLIYKVLLLSFLDQFKSRRERSDLAMCVSHSLMENGLSEAILKSKGK